MSSHHKLQQNALGLETIQLEHAHEWTWVNLQLTAVYGHGGHPPTANLA